MRALLGLLFALCVANPGLADPMQVGDKALQVPAPSGYVLVTEEMDGAYRLGMQMGDEQNDTLGLYIPEALAEEARSGQVPALERYFMLKVHKQLKNLSLGAADFAEMRVAIVEQNDEIMKAVQEQVPALFEQNSRGVSEEFDLDFDMQLGQMIPLKPHLDSEHAMSFSMFMSLAVEANGSSEEVVLAATSTFINVAGKVLFLYCYAPKADLEWTRSASQSWADTILSSNAQAPAEAQLKRGIDWSEAARKGLVGGAIGLMVWLVLYVLGRFKKGRPES